MTLSNQENESFLTSLDPEDVGKLKENMAINLMNTRHQAEPLNNTFSILSLSGLHDLVSEKTQGITTEKHLTLLACYVG